MFTLSCHIGNLVRQISLRSSTKPLLSTRWAHAQSRTRPSFSHFLCADAVWYGMIGEYKTRLAKTQGLPAIFHTRHCAYSSEPDMSNQGSRSDRPQPTSGNDRRSRRPIPAPPSNTSTSSAHPSASSAHPGAPQWGGDVLDSDGQPRSNSTGTARAGPSSQASYQSGGAGDPHRLSAGYDPQTVRNQYYTSIDTGLSYGGHHSSRVGHRIPQGDDSFLSFSSDESANSSPRLQGDESFLSLSGSSSEGSPRDAAFPHNAHGGNGGNSGTQSSPSHAHGGNQGSPRGSGSQLNATAGGSSTNSGDTSSAASAEPTPRRSG